MPVGLLVLELHIPDAKSLKDKRQVVRSLKDRLRGKFNVAVAELEYQEIWNRSILGIVTLSNSASHVERALHEALEESDRILGPILVNHSLDLM